MFKLSDAAKVTQSQTESNKQAHQPLETKQRRGVLITPAP
jgi:hypothetical protein